MAMLNKSLDDLIAEKKAGSKGGRGGGKGKGSLGRGRGGGSSKGSKGFGAGRVAGARGNARLAVQTAVRTSPYSERSQKGRGGGAARAVIERQVMSKSLQAAVQRNRVFVTGLPFDWEKHDILRVMETTGEVDNLTIYWDPTGRPTGNALVAYKSERGAKEAVQELDGARLGNHEITVTIAKEQSQASSGRGAGGRGEKGGRGASAGAFARGSSGKGRANQKSFGRKGGGGRGTYSKAKIEYARVG